jgi:hypothetical protein
MTRQEIQLAALIALKRQGAEQRLQRLSLELGQLDRDEAALRGNLVSITGGTHIFEACKLSHTQGTLDHLLARLDDLGERRRVLAADIDAARDALRRAIHSEGEFAKIAGSD